MKNVVREKLKEDVMFDNSIVGHHFSANMRDYEIYVDVVRSDTKSDSQSIEDHYRYVFTHCVVAEVSTEVKDSNWIKSWSDIFLDIEKWKMAGEPEGFLWGVSYQDAYPGLKYIDDSTTAADWSKRLEKEMHEIVIKTNVQNIRLVFHDVYIDKINSNSRVLKLIK